MFGTQGYGSFGYAAEPRGGFDPEILRKYALATRAVRQPPPVSREAVAPAPEPSWWEQQSTAAKAGIVIGGVAVIGAAIYLAMGDGGAKKAKANKRKIRRYSLTTKKGIAAYERARARGETGVIGKKAAFLHAKNKR